MWRLLGIILMFSFFAFGFFYVPEITYDAPQVAESISSREVMTEVKKEEKKESSSLLFVGDIMLGRDVEARIIENGSMHPFEEVQELLANPDITIGNFEGVVAEEHVQTPSMGFQFSIRNEYLTTLKQVGFDVLSLANNHSFDYGAGALVHTRSICKELRLTCGGTPNELDTHSIASYGVGEEHITFLFLHSVWNVPSEKSLDVLFASVPEESTIKIAYIHWGEEYVLTHNVSQQSLAEKLIDRGVDVVIGHHPHVVQDIGLYKGKPIFYSLGNFIFDQYFSEDVQEGLGVHMEIKDTHITYTLVPFTSKESKNQPRIVQKKEAGEIVQRILHPVIEYSGVDKEKGVLSVFR